MIRALVGALLVAIGLFLYRETTGYYGVDALLIVAIPLTIAGVLLVLKGGKNYLKDKPEESPD
jgi:hypothetical protein